MKEEKAIKDFLQEKLESSGAEGYAIGVSGGIDSATTLKLAAEAVGSEKVEALVMPGAPSTNQNISDAKQLCEELGVDYEVINVEPIAEKIAESYGGASEKSMGNLRARARMTLLYLAANEEQRLVLGTGNRSEYLLGYFTKHGDGAADVKPLLDLYKTEVRELAKSLGLDSKFIEKPPTAGLWKGQSDEEEIGATYDEIDRILRRYVDEEVSQEEVVEETGFSEEKVERIVEMHEESSHKRGKASSGPSANLSHSMGLVQRFKGSL